MIESRPTTRYVALVALMACALLAWAAATSTLGDLRYVAGFAAALSMAQLMPIPIRRGTEVEMVGFEEAIMLPALLALPTGGVLVSMLVALVAWQFIARQPFEKAMFNASQMLVSLGVASIVVEAAVGVAPGPADVAIAAAIGGLSTLFLVNQLLVAGVLSRALRAPFIATLRGDLATKLGIWGVNVSFGLLLVPAMYLQPTILLGAVVLFLFMHASCRAFLRAAHGDDAISGLVDATERLGDDMPVVRVAEHIARVACEVDGACGAMVRLFHEELGDAGSLLAAEFGVAEGDLTFQDGVRGRLAAVLQLEANGTRIGELRVWRDPSQVGRTRVQKRRDRSMLEVVARHGSVALSKALVTQVAADQLQTMAQVFEHANECLVVLDASGAITACNPAMSELVGVPAERLVGMPVGAISPELERVVELGDAGVGDARLVTAKGDRRIVRASYAPTDLEGTSRRRSWVLALHDMTAAHEAERLKSDFVATVSHELRTPLTTIRGFLETMRRDDIKLEPSQTIAFLDIMRGEAIRLDRLINDLLDTSAIEAGRPPSVRICTVDLVQEVRRAVTNFRASRPDASVTWHDDDADPIVVEVDPDRLHQVLTNLLENARRHGTSTRPIEVRTSPGRDGRAGISIRDHGRGIGVDDQARIFERFFFTADSATRNGGGAGLGLYICQRLMHAMDGSIHVHSIPGNGATFSLQLPTSRRPRRQRTLRTPAAPVQQREDVQRDSVQREATAPS